MRIIRTVEALKRWRKTSVDAKTETIGFVPTMGCLHDGHLSLVNESIKSNNYTVVSIFVNPSQFSPTEDLDNYPRTFEEDEKLLSSAGVDIIFAPAVEEIYPRGIPLNVNEQEGPFVSVLGVSEKLEGRTRPNFFRGVATVVTKLLHAVSPDEAYFGQKDLQQFIVLDTMVKELFFDVELIMMPIKRSETGLALSSRNKYFSAESLKIASNIYKGLKEGANYLSNERASPSRETLISVIMSIWKPYIDSKDFEVDYISLARMDNLEEVEPTLQNNHDLALSCAVYVTDRANKGSVVRLIDNIIIPCN